MFTYKNNPKNLNRKRNLDQKKYGRGDHESPRLTRTMTDWKKEREERKKKERNKKERSKKERKKLVRNYFK